ncbi:hypothetical protein [Streptomyces sp. CA-111067]|uniref:hypothetical protein n=1 Tax=Streptomyces sp. CA-111067 TaxID=3240046 RepID=UPI003D973ED6
MHTPADLHFAIADRYRPKELMSAFLTLDDGFRHGGPAYQALPAGVGAPAARVRREGGVLRLTAPGGQGPHGTLLRSDTAQEAPYTAVTVQADGSALQARGAWVAAGLVKDADNHLTARYEPETGRITLGAVTGGVRKVLASGTTLSAGMASGFDKATDVTAGHTVGQGFTADAPFVSLGVFLGNYGINTSQVTLTLLRGGPDGTQVAQTRVTLSVDNSWWTLPLDEAVPAGTYMLQLSDAAGKPAWWGTDRDVVPGGTAYADGAPVAGDRMLKVALVDPATGPFEVGFAITSMLVAAYVRPRGGTWREVVSAGNIDTVDLRVVETARGWKNGFGAGAADGEVALTGVQAGWYGRSSLRDTCLITYADGRPYTRQGRLYLTATNAGLGSNAAGHMGIFSFAPSDFGSLQEVGKIFGYRGPYCVGDYAGKVVVRDDGGLDVFTSTWSTGDLTDWHVDVMVTRAPEARLHGVNVLPPGRKIIDGRYDPSPVLLDGRWRVPVSGLSLWSFDDDFGDARLDAVDAATFYEGPRWQRIDGEWYIFAGGFNDIRVWDRNLKTLGLLDAQHPQAPGYRLVNPPHPVVVQVPVAGGGSQYLLLTFSGDPDPETGEVGEFVVETQRS